MSGAKHRMRNKKLRNQPSNVTYSSPGLSSSHWGNGRDTPPTGRGHGPQRGGQGPSPSGQQAGGWVRGHQKGGPKKRDQAYPQQLPDFITARAFVRARAAEVHAMLKAVTKTTGSSHVFGALPKHMRRRAMSHNTNRLPCRLRDMANKMLDKSKKAGQKEKKEQSKAKSRKARRRHGNLLLEFNRRQRKNVWLETHIWHAKRFHMLKKWGYSLGDRPTYKCYRACYRAMSTHCLLQDMSYHCCVELQGPEEQLLAALSKLTSKEAGPTFAAAVCLSGRRQGSVVVYRAGQHPAQPLGPVLFLWRPRVEGCTHRQLWIWIHPTLKQDLLPELQIVCQCSEAVIPPAPVELSAPEPAPIPIEMLGKPIPGSKRKRASKAAGPPAKKILGDGTRSPMTPVTWKSSTTGITISDLTMEIVRYRLIGPMSHSVLTETLAPATDCDASSKTEMSCFWWPEHCKDEKNMSLHQQQADVFHLLKGIYSTAEIPAGSVLGLTVDDPRLTLPNKRGKAVPDLKQSQEVDEEKRRGLMLQGVPEHCCQSSLWDRSVRDNVTDNKISEQELNRMKSEMLVPGSRLSPTPLQGRVPLLLVQQPGKQVGQEMNSWGTGWDLLLPKGWGMAFWVPLVYRGVRIGGLKMSLKHSQNKGAPHFPHDYPDCPAGARFQEEQETELLTKFKRRPPAKRTNYIKHGCLAPLRCPWQQLAEEWEMIVREDGHEAVSQRGAQVQPIITKAEDVTSHGDVFTPPSFTVLRNRKTLRQLSVWVRPTSSKGQRSQRPGAGAVTPLDRRAAVFLLSAHGRSLVWARLSLLTKGQPELHALVCMPTPEDLQLIRKEPGCSGPREPLHTDHFRSRVKRRKKAHKPAPSSSHKAESKQSEPASVSTPIPCPDPTSAPTPTPQAQDSTSSSSSSTSALTYGLWPEPLPSVTSHCSRVALGWVTQGDFSLSAGCGEALGFLSLTGLLHMLLSQPADQRGLVLLRNPSSLQYRFAKINIEV